MLDGCQHRGPDSTGFALYHETNGARILRLRFFVGEGAEAEEAISRIEERFGEFAAEIVEEEERSAPPRRHGSVRRRSALLLVRDGACRVSSIGESLDIIKDVGSAHDVDDAYHVAGVHGHARDRPRAPRDRVGRVARPATPFFADVAIVHNGQITNYWKMRPPPRSAAWSSTRTTTPS